MAKGKEIKTKDKLTSFAEKIQDEKDSVESTGVDEDNEHPTPSVGKSGADADVDSGASNKTSAPKKTTIPSADKQGKNKKTATQIIASYTKMYPNNKEFHVTSDGQVFLKGDRSLALMHQRTLSGGELETIKVK